MPPVIDPDDDIPEDEEEEYESEEDLDEEDHCPICDSAAGDCDHLVACIDEGFSEIESGAIFAHERTILDTMEHLVTKGPKALKAAGANPALVRAAALVEADVKGGMNMGDAVSTNFPHLIDALKATLEDEGDLTITESESQGGAEDSSAYVNFWSEDAEGVVDRLIDRLQTLEEELNN